MAIPQSGGRPGRAAQAERPPEPPEPPRAAEPPERSSAAEALDRQHRGGEDALVSVMALAHHLGGLAVESERLRMAVFACQRAMPAEVVSGVRHHLQRAAELLDQSIAELSVGAGGVEALVTGALERARTELPDYEDVADEIDTEPWDEP